MIEVLSYGELLIDFSQHGAGPLGFPAYEALPGGGVANMVVALARWGHKTAFAGRVGQDALGKLLFRTIEQEGIDVSRLVSSPRPTTMAIVSLDAKGDRSFDFLWQGTSCDGIPAISPENPAESTKSSVPRIVHFSSVAMCGPEGRKNALASIRSFRQAGSRISFDPNLRTNLWASLDDARSAIVAGLELSDVVKISEEEVAFVLGEEPGDPMEQSRRLRNRFPVPVLFVTLGPKGCLWLNEQGSGAVPAPKVDVVDTTGAGDCFMAGVLHGLLGAVGDWKSLSPRDVERWAHFGVAAGSVSTTKRGGIPSLPTLDTVEALLSRR